MRYLFVTILLSFLIPFQTISGMDDMRLNKIYLECQKEVLQDAFPWMTDRILNSIFFYSKMYNISPVLIASLIQRESTGKVYAIGPVVYPHLYKNGEKRRRKSQAMGLMQVMDFHFALSENHFNPDTNIKKGSKILSKCIRKFHNRKDQLRCYNAGPRSTNYNWVYINDIMRNEQELNKTILMAYTEQL